MAKKGENIYKRKDGRWEGRYVKARTSTGKIIYGSVYGKKYTEVKEKLFKVKAQHLENSAVINPYYDLFSDWLQYWVTTQVKNQVKPTTYSNYFRLIKKHILPLLGNYPLTKLQTKDLQNFIFILQKDLSAGSIKNIFSIVKKCLNDAKRQSYIVENPCDFVELPKAKRTEVHALSIEQQRKLEFVAFQEKGCSPVILSLYSGMRIGEISGLKWSDIDIENELIYVRRTVSRVLDESSLHSKTKLIEGTPKSSRSIRQIPLANNLKKYLLEKHKRAATEYVIEGATGLVEPRTITNHFKRNLKDAGLKDVKFHVLRNTFATRCIEKGIDVASLSKILGHQSIKMTLDTYTDSLMETRRLAMSTIDTMFYGSV
ncbi:site-specific integrase [Enterococcus sp. BWT-B8]|uniref:tyrosine-type recombinase/integrase n=1 Tax=Enterococcus sp. BWT-B8 TaxID=2885157 RepID=UPI001E38673B|nr:site-specific integrase [Enterococcus sp. BWT-B8]MCB5952543.1 site-specific integrase [Enterococcus sp. BWT-B8]